MADDKAKQLAAELQSYHRAIETEFAVEDPDDPAQVRDALRRTLLKEMQELTDGIITLAKSAVSENVQLSALKYAIDLAIGKGSATSEDALEDLVKSIRKEAPK